MLLFDTGLTLDSILDIQLFIIIALKTFITSQNILSVGSIILTGQIFLLHCKT